MVAPAARGSTTVECPEFSSIPISRYDGEMSDPLARVAELETENEELRARIEAAERSQVDDAALLRRLEEAKRDGLALRQRRELLERRDKLGGWKLLALALLVGVFLGIVQALRGHR